MTEVLPNPAYHFQPMLIDGQWCESENGVWIESLDPATGSIVASIPAATPADADRAVLAAHRALTEGPWSRMSPLGRQALIFRLHELVERDIDILNRFDCLEMGAPISRLRAGRARVSAMLRYYGSAPLFSSGRTIDNSAALPSFSYTLVEPVGVVAAITPWNAPLNSAIWKIGPVLATGCTMVLKPSEISSLSALHLGKLIEEAGFPPGVVNIVTGYGHVAGETLINHPLVSKVAFTGSKQTGQHIVRASAGNFKKLTLELGGKSANIVFDDVDIETAVAGAILAGFSNTGQICSSGTRLFVQEGIYKEFTTELASALQKIRIGAPLAPETEMGPLASLGHSKRVSGFYKRALANGAEVIGGAHLERPGDGACYVNPVLLANAHDDMEITRDEVFGPVVVALPFRTVDEAVTRANGSSYALAAGVWTRDLSRAHEMTRRLEAGTVWVNAYHLMDPAVPFGGNKDSGYGRESGLEHLAEFQKIKSVWIKH